MIFYNIQKGHMLNTIRELNKQRKIYTPEDILFSKFGRLLDIDVDDIMKESSYRHFDENGNKKVNYQLNIHEFHQFSWFKTIQHDIFGEMNIQAGIVKGRNQTLTGTEFHQGSEVNIALTDCILMLADKHDFSEDHGIDGSLMNAFYIKKGQVIELYSTTLHYTPIEVGNDGFAMIVILLEGTNEDLPFKKNALLCKRNKWYVCHPTCQAKIDQGFRVGLTGELITINHD